MCHHFHLSLQSGCDETLARMNRRYTTKQFREIVNRIRNRFNDSILTTDIIVGFAGETEEEFSKTYEFLKEIKFYKMHIFKFSVRKGTKAELMNNQVPSDIKENIQEDIFEGFTSNYLKVRVRSKENIQNKILTVKVTKREDLKLVGNII